MKYLLFAMLAGGALANGIGVFGGPRGFDEPLPQAPVVRSVQCFQGSAELKWTETDPSGGMFRVYYGTTPRLGAQHHDTRSLGVLLTGLQPDTTYYFAVQFFSDDIDKDENPSPPSTEVSCTTL